MFPNPATEAILAFRHALASGRFSDVRHEDLVTDPAGQMEQVHQALDVPLTDAGGHRVWARPRRARRPAPKELETGH